MKNLEEKINSLGLVEWWIQVKNKVKKLVIGHSTRRKHETLDIENNSDISSNFKLHSELKKKLAKLQIESFKLLKNEQLFQYSNNLASKEFNLYKNVGMSSSTN